MPDESPNVLIVDDDPQFRRTFADVLEQSAYDTTAVGTPQAAVHTTEKDLPTEEIVANKGVLYHPDVVDTTVKLLTENGHDLKGTTDSPKDA